LIQKGKILKAQFLLRTQFTLLLVFVHTPKHSAARYQHFGLFCYGGPTWADLLFMGQWQVGLKQTMQTRFITSNLDKYIGSFFVF